VFDFQVDLMLASGNLSGTPSSVIDLSGEEPMVVREGAAIHQSSLDYFSFLIT